MHVDTDAEVLRLRAVLRDLMALSAIPAVWIGGEPPGVATGLADELVELLQLDFAFVRLCDPDGAGAVEVTRGDTWKRFPEWLESHLATSVQFPLKEIFPDIGGGSDPCRGIAIRIGVNGERGVVAAASDRSDFPTATDQLLLSLAANQAATAFQTSRLIQELRRAEEKLREARNELETKVAERTAELRRSRARLLTAADEARRRVVRDLHDGAQQRLVHTIITLKLAQRALGEEGVQLESLIGEALEQAEQGNTELRELAHGILPPVLTGGGLRAAVGSVVNQLDLPVEVDVPAERFPAEIEASAYFIVAEALTNVVKHANAGRANVRASAEDGMLHLEVRDDGIGGADPGGHGLVGIADRATALGGRLNIENPVGGGTLVAATLPLPAS